MRRWGDRKKRITRKGRKGRKIGGNRRKSKENLKNNL
jgi:hypothetical protein